MASRSANASSMLPIMVLKAAPSWPTSPRPSAGLARRDRSPPAMARAVARHPLQRAQAPADDEQPRGTGRGAQHGPDGEVVDDQAVQGVG